MNLLRKIFDRKKFYSSKYWENRYKAGGNSGSGSYSNLAIFKAEIINSFVKDNKIESVIEFGCGDGQQLNSLILTTILDLTLVQRQLRFA